MQFINALIEYHFMSNALLAAVLSGIVCGIIGTYIVARRMVFLSGGITHASFGGIGIGYYFGFDPIAGAAGFAVVSALAVDWASRRGKIRNDSAIGIAWSLGMAIGIIFIFITPGYAPNLMSYLFGNILTVTDNNVILLACLSVVLITVFALSGRTIVYAAFDPDFSRSRGVNTDLVSAIMSVLIALSIVLTIKMVGIIMLISLLTIPAVTVNIATKSYRKIIVWAVVVAALGNIVGLYVSWKIDIPCSAATIFVLVLTLVTVKLVTFATQKSKLTGEKNR